MQSGLGDPAIPYLYYLCWDSLIKSDVMFHNIWSRGSFSASKLFKLYLLAHSVVGLDQISLTHAAFSATTNQTRPNHVPLTTVGRSKNCRTIKLVHSQSPQSKMVSIKCDIWRHFPRHPLSFLHDTLLFEYLFTCLILKKFTFWLKW